MSASSREPDDGSSVAQLGGSTTTYAAFSPGSLGHSRLDAQRSTVLVHQKSPLLVATPPQITRVLAYSHPFVTPLNRLVGLLSWTSGDPWASFLLVAAFWAITLYGDIVIRWAGPPVVVALLILGMYARRHSALSSTSYGGKVEKGHARSSSDVNTRHHKSLDEIVDELKLFISRCNILLDPALRLTDFLSTQQSATTATTRPALTALFIRILFITPVWIILTFPPLYIITTRRVVLVLGTILLTWHSRPARVTRTILWRSRSVRRALAAITGLQFSDVKENRPPLPQRRPRNANDVAASLAAKRRPESPGIRFTFTIYENQRRWLGIGWTSSMLAYERASWTDEELNPCSPRDQFELPDVEGGRARWRWADGSNWHLEGADENESRDQERGWTYYDSKWHGGRRDQDGWGRYTRRRKWCRDAELVEVTESTEITPSPTPGDPAGHDLDAQSEADTDAGTSATAVPDSASQTMDDALSVNSAGSAKKRRWFRRSSGATHTASSEKSAAAGSGSSHGSGRRDDEDDTHTPMQQRERDYGWRGPDDMSMSLG